VSPIHYPDASSQADVMSDAELLALAGPVGNEWDECRRHPRFYYRAKVEGTIHPPNVATHEQPKTCQMMTRDISRGGMNLLHTDQLFPGQRIDVAIKDGCKRLVEVVWCRRLAHRCYSIGCRFVKENGADDGQLPTHPAEAGGTS